MCLSIELLAPLNQDHPDPLLLLLVNVLLRAGFMMIQTLQVCNITMNRAPVNTQLSMYKQPEGNTVPSSAWTLHGSQTAVRAGLCWHSSVLCMIRKQVLTWTSWLICRCDMRRQNSSNGQYQPYPGVLCMSVP